MALSERLRAASRPAARPQPEEQLLFSRLLDWGTRIGFVVLVTSFIAYLFGWLTPHVPLEQLPSLWSLPVATYLERAGMPTGWGWVDLIHRSDIANLGGIVLLAGASLLPLLAVVPLYLKQRDRTYAAICLLEVAVILLAASGVLAAGL